MKIQLIPLIGDPLENLYHLGQKERESFRRLEERVLHMLSANPLLRRGQDLVSRARTIWSRREPSFFDDCIKAYAEGLAVDPSSYLSFISLFELAAHYGQSYPELKGLLPGCTSLFEKTPEGLIHSRLIDFPLIGIFEQCPRLYYWKVPGKGEVLSYSCEGLAPLFFQALHHSGFSLALHHKPGNTYHHGGTSIFSMTFNTLFEAQRLSDFRRDIRKNTSLTKWGFYLLDSDGQVLALDIDGPSFNLETYNLNETSPLIFTNVPLRHSPVEQDNYFYFCKSRQDWLREKLKGRRKLHALDVLLDVKDQKGRNWMHPTGTLSTVGAISLNLTRGLLHVKDGDSALTAADAIVEFSLADQSPGAVIKEALTPTEFELSWKRAARAQSAYDSGDLELAYHELQMALAVMPHPTWKEIFRFFLTVWDFKYVQNRRELAVLYKSLKNITPPEPIMDQWTFLCMRLEKRLDLQPTVSEDQLLRGPKQWFAEEKAANMPLFNSWMKLLYPRLEILDVFSPHHK